MHHNDETSQPQSPALPCSSASLPATADPVADFYRGKQIRFIVRTTPGTDYDEYSRLIARFMGKHIPGNPSMIVVNMPGGGGITAANYMAQIAPHDGTVIGIVSQGLAADQALGMSPQLKADLREFNWIANVDLLEPAARGLAHLADQDARGRQEARHDHRHDRRRLGLGAVSGFLQQRARHQVQDRRSAIPAAQHIDLAMERGEVEGRGTNPYSSYMATHPDWITKKLIIPLIQVRRREGAGAAGRAADHSICR